MERFAVDLLVPHRLRRWVLPLGFLGLAMLAAVTLALPKDQGATALWIGRVVFVIAYLVLLTVGYGQTRRKAVVHVDETGLREGELLLAERASFECVLSSRKNARTTIEVRGKTPLALEVTSGADADALLAALDPGRDRATASFLATTTPVYMVVLAWMGIPVVLSVSAQFLPQLPTEALIAYAIPSGLLWLGSSWWFMRRRRVTVTTSDLELPLLFSTQPQVMSLTELAEIALPDPYTVELRFASRRPRKLKIYDPALLAEFVDRLKTRSRATVLDLTSAPKPR